MEELLLELKDLKSQQDLLKEKEAEIKEKLETEYLTEEGYKTEYATVSYSKPSSTTSIDLKTLQEKEPDLYNELLEDYPKTTNKKGSFSYRFK